MIAAVYARKSTDQTGMSDEERSVARQVAHAKAYAAKKGWTVPDELIFVDDGISGAEFVKRPGFIQLMKSLKPKPSFQFLVMSEESRLGRESIETSWALKQIIDAGVRLFFYLEDRERTLDSAMDKVMLSLVNFSSEMERERAKQRTYDAMRRKALAGHVTGGCVFGYDNQEVCASDGSRQHVVYVINEREANVVRQIFTMYANGLGFHGIAKRLNNEGVPPPRQGSCGWAGSAIREMLYRPLYRGQIVWNALEKIVRGGTKKRRRRDEKDWIRVDAPHLCIIDPVLWEAVQARLASNHTGTGPRLRDVETPYLLTGLCRCDTCKGPITMSGPGSPKSHRRRGKFYTCSYHLRRGSSVCRNATMAPQEGLEKAVLKALSDLLHPRVLDRALQEAMEQLQPDQTRLGAERGKIEEQLAKTKAAQQRLTDAIAQGGSLEVLLEGLKREEAKQRDFTAELDRLSTIGPNEWDVACIRREAKSRLGDIQGLLSRQPREAKAILKRLFDAPLLFGSVEEDGKVKFVVEGSGNFLNLLGVSDSQRTPPSNVVSPIGM
ncbi:MAG: recombinase family protein [Nitrospira sp.]|nr:recombinase family protein [Nitrospira sp.]